MGVRGRSEPPPTGQAIVAETLISGLPGVARCNTWLNQPGAGQVETTVGLARTKDTVSLAIDQDVIVPDHRVHDLPTELT